MADQKKKRAMKRLAQDLLEIQSSPVPAVSATPLDNNMFEWHCNFTLDDVVYHVILFFPDTYPFVSPSAEFIPKGFQFTGGATMHGKKGVKVCLSIFSDFANYHPEWATEKSAGWSPGYTVQTVLLNLLSYLQETMSNSWGQNIAKNNANLAKKFSCKDCGHKHSKPFPPLEDDDAMEAEEKIDGPEIVDYISKTRFIAANKPKTKDDLYGFGLIQSGPTTRPAFTSPCEYLTGSSFYGMHKELGYCQSIMKDKLAFFLPIYISKVHGGEIQKEFEETMKALSQVIPNCKRAGIDDMVIKTIPNLMSATVVEFSKGTQHTSDNHLCGYFALHRLFLWAIETYPELQKKIDDRLEKFIKDDAMRSKNKCPHIGEWLMLLAGSSKYRWSDAANAYLSESWRRNVMWYVKDNAKLGYLDTDKAYRLEHTVGATAVSRKLLAFQVLFLDIAMPAGFDRQKIIRRYDDNCGLPTDTMVTAMKQACDKITGMKTYSDWFKVLMLPVPNDAEIFKRLKYAVEFSINTKGYHWTFWKNQGGWKQVLEKYPKGTPGWVAPVAGAKDADEDEETEPTPKGKGKGKGKSSAKKVEAPKPTKRKAEDPPAKGRGRKKAKVESESEEEMEVEEKPAAKGRGRGKARGGGARGGGARGRGRGKRGK